MRIWIENENNVYKYYEWFAERAKEDNIKAEMSIISINALGINSNNIKKFIDVCTKQLKNFFNSEVLNNYKLYIFANIEISNLNSKIERYLKVWKKIAKKYDIEGFCTGEEVMNELGNLLFYTSTAEIPLSYLEKSIKIAISNPDRYALFISKSEKVLFREYIQHMFEDIIKVDDYGIIDYYKFLMTCYRNGDIALRYGTTFTDAELAIIYNPKEIEINNYFDIKAF